MSSNENSICFSHIEDPDGIISAALIKQIFNSDIHLVDYNNFISEIEKIEKNLNLKNLIICDLEIKLNIADTFCKIIENLSKKNISILYIDHHNLDSNVSERLKKFNVKVIHSENECTSALIYNNFIEIITCNNNINLINNLFNRAWKIANQIINNSIFSNSSIHFPRCEITKSQPTSY